jgi:hypothetical protein
MPLKLMVLAMGLVAALLGYLGYDRMVKSQIVYFSTSDSWQVVRAGASDGPLLVQSVGDAMGQKSETLAAAIAAKLAANFSEPWLKFDTDRSKTKNPFRLVYFLDAAADRHPDFAQICQGSVPRQHPDGENVNLYAVLCGPNGPINAVHGWTKRPERADDAALGRLYVQTALSAMRGKT